MTILKIMCGVPASGKTTYIKNHAAPGDLIVSRDKIRKALLKPGMPYFSKDAEVFDLFCQAINNSLIPPAYPVVWVDATHLNNTSRWKLLYGINRNAFEEIDFIAIETSLEKCLERNEMKDESERVPIGSIKRMYEAYKRPSYNDFLSLRKVKIEVINN